jgi:thiol:disulfide interchange protein
MALSPARGIRQVAILRMVMLVTLLSLPCCGERGDREASGERGDTSGDSRAPRAPRGREVRWHSSLPDALQVAREVKKPLMVDFFSDRCGWCKVLDQKTYTDPAVRSRAEQFVSVKIDLGKDPGPASQYRVMGLPTVLFMNCKGEVIHSVIGFRPPAPFLVEMQKALEKAASAR